MNNLFLTMTISLTVGNGEKIERIDMEEDKMRLVGMTKILSSIFNSLMKSIM